MTKAVLLCLIAFAALTSISSAARVIIEDNKHGYICAVKLTLTCSFDARSEVPTIADKARTLVKESFDEFSKCPKTRYYVISCFRASDDGDVAKGCTMDTMMYCTGKDITPESCESMDSSVVVDKEIIITKKKSAKITKAQFYKGPVEDL